MDAEAATAALPKQGGRRGTPSGSLAITKASGQEATPRLEENTSAPQPTGENTRALPSMWGARVVPVTRFDGGVAESSLVVAR
jgi:hypothetical protein